MKDRQVHPTILKQIDDAKVFICKRLKVSYDYIHIRTRDDQAVLARYFVYKYTRKHTRLSLAVIASNTFNQNHATIINGLRKLGEVIDTDKEVRDHDAYFEIEMKYIFSDGAHVNLNDSYSLIGYQTRARLYHSIK